MSKLMTYSMVSLVVILLTAFVLFNFQGKIKEAYAEATAKQTCKTSVKTHAALKLRYADFSGEIKCPTVKLKIEDKNEEIVKKKIADAMYYCWDGWDRGVRELFSDDSVYCAICHRVTFDRDIKINGFLEYLASNNPLGEKISYLQFLTIEQTSNAEFLQELENKKIVDTIDASKNNEYAIIFTYIKGKKYLDEYLTKAKYTTPGLGLIGIGFGIFKAGGIVGGALSTIATPAIGAPVGLSISSIGGFVMAVGALWTGLAGYFSGVPFEHIALISFIPYDAQHIKDLNCIQIPVKQ